MDPYRVAKIFPLPTEERIASIPPSLVGTWKLGDVTLRIGADRRVVFDNSAILNSCKLEEHVEGMASTRADGTLVLEFEEGVDKSYVKTCEGETLAHSKFGAWYAYRVDDTTAGIRLALDQVYFINLSATESTYDKKVDRWGDDYYYLQR